MVAGGDVSLGERPTRPTGRGASADAPERGDDSIRAGAGERVIGFGPESVMGLRVIGVDGRSIRGDEGETARGGADSRTVVPTGPRGAVAGLDDGRGAD